MPLKDFFLSRLRALAKRNIITRKLIGYHLPSTGLFDNTFRSFKVSPEWEVRIANVMKSPDISFIPTVPDAGKIRNGKQRMHNGLQIYVGSYYGPEYARMLSISKGIHEPQEERVFQETLRNLEAGSVMLELGAFWGFYSMWFNKVVPNAVNFLVEPDAFNLGQGKRNFRLNKMRGKFTQAFVGKASSEVEGQRIVCVDDFITENAIDFIHVLHSDIQGYEMEMLQGAVKAMEARKIGYVFISTHSNALHYDCLEFLKSHDFAIVASADIDESFSEDGLIVGRAKHFPGLDKIEISLRSKVI